MKNEPIHWIGYVLFPSHVSNLSLELDPGCMMGACASRSGRLSSSWVVRWCVGRWWAHARHAPVGSVLLGLCAGVLVGGGRMRVTLR